MHHLVKIPAVSDEAAYQKIIIEESGPVIFPLYEYLQIFERIFWFFKDNFDVEYEKVNVTVRSA